MIRVKSLQLNAAHMPLTMLHICSYKETWLIHWTLAPFNPRASRRDCLAPN